MDEKTTAKEFDDNRPRYSGRNLIIVTHGRALGSQIYLPTAEDQEVDYYYIQHGARNSTRVDHDIRLITRRD